ncbi:Ctf8-domain-containing protein [Boletus edulis BED1]|uniref:Ctf8-domain-containing protein n=1 Tax=Boletus edulis BED1 TaxID=1328754 RepID=A0AAD4BV46_BOLED|nr:Ctf8-domain-containing protein [Boletus edulis BED1]
MIVPIAVRPLIAFSPKLAPSIANLGHDGLFLIELQGMLDVQGCESTSKDGQLIGTLNTADMGKPTLVIGHHLLEGKVVTLSKPLGVLHKHVHARNDGPSAVHPDVSEDEDEDNHECEAQKKEKDESKQVRWDVIAVVKKKMVFSKRPMPTIAKPASTASRGP